MLIRLTVGMGHSACCGPSTRLWIVVRLLNYLFSSYTHFSFPGPRVSHVPFGKLPAGCHAPFSDEWLSSGHYTRKAWLMECCSNGCPSVSFPHFLKGNLDVIHSGRWVIPVWPRPCTQLLRLAIRSGKTRWFQASHVFPYILPQMLEGDWALPQCLVFTSCETFYRQVSAFSFKFIRHRWTLKPLIELELAEILMRCEYLLSLGVLILH